MVLAGGMLRNVGDRSDVVIFSLKTLQWRGAGICTIQLDFVPF